jgi:hypothetical protein
LGIHVALRRLARSGGGQIAALGAVLAWALSLPLRIAPLVLGKASMAAEVAYIGIWLVLLALDLEAPRLMLAGALAVAVLTLLSAFAYGRVFLHGLFFGGRTA